MSPPPLRIALVAEDYYPQLGGVPEHVHHLARELDRLGHNTTIVTSKMRGHHEEEHADVRRVGTSLVIYANGGVARVTVGWQLTADSKRCFARNGSTSFTCTVACIRPSDLWHRALRGVPTSRLSRRSIAGFRGLSDTAFFADRFSAYSIATRPRSQ